MTLWQYPYDRVVACTHLLFLIFRDFLLRFSYQVLPFQEDALSKNCPYSELFWSVFPPYGLNTERYRVSLRLQSECGKIRTRITPNRDTFQTIMFHYLEMYLLFSMPYLTRYDCIPMNTETHLRFWQIPMIKMFLQK